MAKRKKKKKTKNQGRFSFEWPELLGEEQRIQIVRKTVGWSAALVAVAALCAGMNKLDRHVHAQDRFAGLPTLTLIDLPDDLVFLEGIIHQHLDEESQRPWAEPALCRQIAERLSECAWIRSIEKVQRRSTGMIDISCSYRRPVMQVQNGRGFALIDRDGVRLPGDHGYLATLPLVQGVRSPAPDPGQLWKAPDLSAGMQVLALIADQRFADQVVAVLVHNYEGRSDSRACHLELATDRMGGRIFWGSAPGQEIEENTPEQKLAILVHNFETTGRIDAGHAVIDISTFSDRYTTPNVQ